MPSQRRHRYGRKIYRLTQVQELIHRVFYFRCLNDVYVNKSHLPLKSFVRNLDLMLFNHYNLHKRCVVRYRFINVPITRKEQYLAYLAKEEAKIKLKELAGKPKEI